MISVADEGTASVLVRRALEEDGVVRGVQANGAN